MTGLTQILCTKQDYINAVRMAKQTGEGVDILIAKLRAVKATTNMMALKAESWAKRAETQHQKDYESTADANCEMRRLGFSAEEIDGLIGELQNV